MDDKDLLAPNPGDVIGYPVSLGDTPGEITSVSGNAACQASGQPQGTACNPALPATCVLPCIIGPLGTDGDDIGTQPTPGGALPTPTNLVLPGAATVADGSVRFKNTSPLIVGEVCPDESPSTLDDRGVLQNAFVCEPNEPGCSVTPNTADAPANLICEEVVACPYVSITKTCDGVTADGECLGDVTVTVDNLNDGEPYRSAATNCVVTDTFDGNSIPLYEADGVTPAPASFDLAPGETRVFKATVGPYTGTIVNIANITCDEPVSPPPPPAQCRSTDTAEAPCTCGGDNYKCYTVKPAPRTPRFPATVVGLEDQFRTTSARLLTPYELCNPVDKNGEGIANPDAHLLCYKFIDRARAASVPVEVTDQFFTEDLRTSSANVLCVPALKNCDPQTQECSIGALEEELNHFQCYGALPLMRGDELLTPDDVHLADQFTDGLATFPPARRRQLCTPTAKNGGNIPDETEHLKCYNIRDEDRFLGTEVDVIDQFGTWKLRVGQARELCESAEKTRLDRGPVDDTRSRSRR